MAGQLGGPERARKRAREPLGDVLKISRADDVVTVEDRPGSVPRSPSSPRAPAHRGSPCCGPRCCGSRVESSRDPGLPTGTGPDARALRALVYGASNAKPAHAVSIDGPRGAQVRCSAWPPLQAARRSAPCCCAEIIAGIRMVIALSMSVFSVRTSWKRSQRISRHRRTANKRPGLSVHRAGGMRPAHLIFGAIVVAVDALMSMD